MSYVKTCLPFPIFVSSTPVYHKVELIGRIIANPFIPFLFIENDFMTILIICVTGRCIFVCAVSSWIFIYERDVSNNFYTIDLN